jgi:hypothetical protein
MHACLASLPSFAAQIGKHARYYWLLLAESGLTQRLFGSIGSGVFPDC